MLSEQVRDIVRGKWPSPITIDKFQTLLLDIYEKMWNENCQTWSFLNSSKFTKLEHVFSWRKFSLNLRRDSAIKEEEDYRGPSKKIKRNWLNLTLSCQCSLSNPNTSLSPEYALLLSTITVHATRMPHASSSKRSIRSGRKVGSQAPSIIPRGSVPVVGVSSTNQSKRLPLDLSLLWLLFIFDSLLRTL